MTASTILTFLGNVLGTVGGGAFNLVLSVLNTFWQLLLAGLFGLL